MKFLVTGGAGFIGSATCRYLIAELGQQVVVVDKLTYAANLASLASISSDSNYQLIRADICNKTAMDDVFASTQPNIVIHLAAESHVDRSIDGPSEFVNTNIFGTYRLLESALQYFNTLKGKKAEQFRFHHVSSDEVFGQLPLEEGLFSEDTPYAPSSPYSASKAASDHLAMAWFHTFNLPVVLSNCSNNYGQCQFPEKLIPLIILNAIEDKPLPVYGDGSNIRDWLHVEDHAHALHLVATKGEIGQSYNIGGNAERSNLQVVEAICDSLDRLRPFGESRHYRDQIKFVTDRPGHDLRYAIDASKIKSHLGWEASMSFTDGLERTIKWYLENESWWKPLREQHHDGKQSMNNPDDVRKNSS